MAEKTTQRTPFTERVEALFASALRAVEREPALTELHAELIRSHERLKHPMRVAIVGLIKAGKSTMINALLGDGVVATGAVETTFNVNWLRYGDERRIEVHFKDGRPPELRSFDDLQALTRRAEENRRELLNIKFIQVHYPNVLLQIFNLIDTPGLASTWADDSRNTAEFLQLHGRELAQSTEEQAANADAVIYLFSRGLADADQAIVEQFQGPLMRRVTPVNAVGVLTRVDSYWSSGVDPLEGGQRIVGRLVGHPDVRQLFYTIKPVCGLLAVGAQTLTEDEFAALRALAELPADRLGRLLRHAERFVREQPDLAVPPDARRAVLDRLGQYGVALACELLRAQRLDEPALRRELLERSGIPELRELITSHFGNRAYLIKLCTALRRVQKACFDARRVAREAVRPIVNQVAGEFERLEAEEHAFRELRVLRSHYEGKLQFSEEESRQLLEVTGEKGIACGRRLGLDDAASIDDMLAQALQRVCHWSSKANDFIGNDSATTEAAEVVARSYERVAYHLQQAREWLTIH